MLLPGLGRAAARTRRRCLARLVAPLLRAKAEATRHREALEAFHRERRLHTTRTQEESVGKMGEQYDPCTEKHSTVYLNLAEVQSKRHFMLIQ